MQYQKGQRVVYTGKSSIFSEPEYIGRIGTVVNDGGDLVTVKWDMETYTRRPSRGLYRENIGPLNEEKEMTQFKKGDRVEYKRANARGGSPYDGRKGTVIRADYLYSNSVRVEWDDGDPLPPAPNVLNLILVPKPSEEEVQKALAVLKLAGEVTFKPTRLPFKPLVIKLNSEYTAEVTEKCVKVGCQTFSFDLIDWVALAVDRARAHAAVYAEENK